MATQEQQMQHLLRTSSITLALLSGVGLAAAQQTGGGNTPSMDSPQTSNSSQQILTLSPAQRKEIAQALRGEQTQSSAQGEQAQIGSEPPPSVSQRALPNQVTSDMPQTKRLLFVKLPDRILLIDPNEQMVAEIIPIGDTSGQDSSDTSPSSGNQ
jgi:hypothetical protein